jgi:hypothetical protein
MTHLRNNLRRFVPRTKVGVLFACAIVASTSVSLTVASSAEALSGTATSSKYLAGYAATPSGTSIETAQVTLTVPQLSCTTKKQDLYIFQYLEINQGNYAEALVSAACSRGTPQYGATAAVCAFTGCGGCDSTGFSVSAGDSVTFSETADSGNTNPVEASVSDTTNSGGILCEEFGDFPSPGPVYTGVCGQDLSGRSQSDPLRARKPPPVGFCVPTSILPEFSPVAFTGATVDSQSLGSWVPTRYNMVSSGVLQVNTRNLKDSGQSFKDVFAP